MFKKLTWGHPRSFRGHGHNSLTLDPMWTKFGPWIAFDPGLSWWGQVKWPLGQRLSMDQIWSTWDQGSMRYGRDLKMTSDDLRSTFWTFLRFDLKWPFDLEWPWPHPPKVSLRTPNPNPFMSPSFNPVGLTVLEICLGRRTAHGARRTADGERRTGKVNAISLPEIFRRDKNEGNLARWVSN